MALSFWVKTGRYLRLCAALKRLTVAWRSSYIKANQSQRKNLSLGEKGILMLRTSLISCYPDVFGGHINANAKIIVPYSSPV